jgi:hypothetical protein
MRKALSLTVIATLLIAAVVDVVAAGVKTGVVRNHFYYAAPASGVGIAVPPGMKLSDRTTAAVTGRLQAIACVA